MSTTGENGLEEVPALHSGLFAQQRISITLRLLRPVKRNACQVNCSELIGLSVTSLNKFLIQQAKNFCTTLDRSSGPDVIKLVFDLFSRLRNIIEV